MKTVAITLVVVYVTATVGIPLLAKACDAANRIREKWGS